MVNGVLAIKYNCKNVLKLKKIIVIMNLENNFVENI